MKAAVFLEPGKIEIKDVDKPKYNNKEVLLRVKSCAVCGTDVRIFYHGQKNVVPPQIIGHEIGGVIEEVGKDVTGYKAGEKVTVVTSVSCDKCSFCSKGLYNLCDSPRYIGYYFPGGYAEYMVVPEEAVRGENILKISGNIDYPEISMIEPLSCCINGQEYLNIQQGERVVIFGAGPIGCMHAELARVKGASKIILVDISEKRLELARRFSITDFINSSKVKDAPQGSSTLQGEDPVKKILDLTDKQGVEVIIVACSAKQAQEQALAVAGKKARISFFAGLPKDNPYIKFDSNIIHYKEISVYGAFASYRKQYEKAAELISKGKIDAKKFITHTFPLDKIVSAIETTKSAQGLKSVVTL